MEYKLETSAAGAPLQGFAHRNGGGESNCLVELGIFNRVFAVPNTIVDEYIKTASGDNLKVLLYCLRHAGQGLSAGELSRATGVEPDSVAFSLEFWQNKISSAIEPPVNTNTLRTPLSSLHTVENSHPADSPPNLETAKSLLRRDCEFDPTEISDLVQSSKQVEYFFQRAEELYGKPLTHTQQSALAVIVEEIGMNPAIALMLLEYCASLNKLNTRYIKRTAESWLEQGIDSIEKAEEHLKTLKEYQSAEDKLIRLLKVKDIPDNRKPLLHKWLFELGHSVEKIYEVYQITLENTGKLEYTYMDKILSGDNSSKPKHYKKSKYERAKGSSGAPSFDLDELERQIREDYKRGLGLKDGV
jgi:DnaD/phage-associated family protein